MKGHTYVSNPVDELGYVAWSDLENETWNKLFVRQKEMIKGRACSEFLKGLELLNFSADEIPQIPEINKTLQRTTGWGVEPVPALIQPQKFFTLLANKRFPAATFIRTPEDLDYIKEPDIFHEVYGHTPLLTNQAYADFMENFGKLALKVQPKDRRRMFRLFWFTIEFGLLKTDNGLKAYGGGILSSIGETQFCLTDTPKKHDFDVLEALRTPYRIDIMQPVYFVLNQFDDLFSILDNDVLELVEKSKKIGDHNPLYPPIEKEEESGAMKC